MTHFLWYQDNPRKQSDQIDRRAICRSFLDYQSRFDMCIDIAKVDSIIFPVSFIGMAAKIRSENISDIQNNRKFL